MANDPLFDAFEQGIIRDCLIDCYRTYRNNLDFIDSGESRVYERCMADINQILTKHYSIDVLAIMHHEDEIELEEHRRSYATDTNTR